MSFLLSVDGRVGEEVVDRLVGKDFFNFFDVGAGGIERVVGFGHVGEGGRVASSYCSRHSDASEAAARNGDFEDERVFGETEGG